MRVMGGGKLRLYSRLNIAQRKHTMADDDREVLQRFLDNLFRHTKRVSRLDVILRAETLDLDGDLLPLFENLPSGQAYTRDKLADQLNSAIVGHGWSRRYGTVD